MRQQRENRKNLKEHESYAGRNLSAEGDELGPTTGLKHRGSADNSISIKKKKFPEEE
jgi:hypothetical protein